MRHALETHLLLVSLHIISAIFHWTASEAVEAFYSSNFMQQHSVWGKSAGNMAYKCCQDTAIGAIRSAGFVLLVLMLAVI